MDGAPIGSVLDDKYRIESFQRPGRFGDLWRATRLADGRTVSVKLLKSDHYTDGEAIRRFQREVKLLLEFEHPYLLRVLDHGNSPTGDPYLVLEHVAGRLLAELVASGPVPVDRVRHVGAQIARVLAVARTRGIVHRGLAPQSILMVDGTDDVKVLDFGLALPPTSTGEPRLTSLGQRIGDPAYMAPEYIDSFSFSASTDLYGLGVLLYELLTGAPPFVGKVFDVLHAHVERDPRPPSVQHPEGRIPSWLDQVVLGLLEKEPATRPDAAAVARALVSGTWPPPVS